MEDSTEITYWLSEPGEAEGKIQITSTVTSKVPEAGEVIHLDTNVDREWAERVFSEKLLKTLPQEESCIKGKFLVVKVNRFIRRVIVKGDLKDGEYILKDIPLHKIFETFEVVIEPFRHTELTETPIAKLRNALGPVFACVQALQLINEYPEKEKEIMELFKKSLAEEVNTSLEKSKELLKDDKNWK